MLKNNAASRLLRVIAKAREIRDPQRVNLPAGENWPIVFEIGDANRDDRDLEVIRLLGLSLDQARCLKREFQARGTDASFYEPRISRIERGFAPRDINSQWQPSILVQFDDPTVAWLEGVAEFLPSPEPPLTDQQLADIKTILGEFLVNVESADLPDTVREFMHKQAMLIQGALRAYRIIGAQAFRDASDDAGTEWVRHASDIQPYARNPVVKEGAGLWQKVEKVAGRTLVIGGALGVIFAGGSGALRALEAYHAFPPAFEQLVDPLLHVDGDEKKLGGGSRDDRRNAPDEALPKRATEADQIST